MRYIIQSHRTNKHSIELEVLGDRRVIRILVPAFEGITAEDILATAKESLVSAAGFHGSPLMALADSLVGKVIDISPEENKS